MDNPGSLYGITLYTFNPRLAKRINSNHFIDLVQGILYLVHRTYYEKEQVKEHCCEK